MGICSMTTSMTNELYSNVPVDVQQELTEEAKSGTASQGSKLIQHGVSPSRLIFLDSGSAEITVPVAGKPISLGTVGPGKVLGLRSVMCGEVPEIDVTCLEDCEITLLSSDTFLDVLRRNPQMYFAVVKILSADLKTVQSFLREKTGRAKAEAARPRPRPN
jgi:CRP/FNR family transcriptional regulator, polysaccharide utilization system transcription regulator